MRGRGALPEVTISESRGVRYLHLGTPWIQGAMRIDEPLEIELDYVQRMMAWMLFRDEDKVTRGHAVQLGLGAAAITRFCLRRLKMRTTAVELNADVIAACRMWFRLPDDSEQLAVLEMDAADFVADPGRRGSVDVLAVDLYDHEAASPVLDSAAFYRDCRDALADRGVMSVNLFGRDASFETSFARIAAAFGADSVLSLKPTREGNTVVIAMKHVTVPDRAVLARRAENIETRWKLPARKWLRMLRPLEPRPTSVSDLPPE
ncbi:MAG: spermidine synthase [Pseudomonadota bacterium]|nr:spermidine synthase [Pseudomonadota bacterium]